MKSKRRAASAKTSNNKAVKKEESSADQRCVGCQSSSAPVDLEQNTQAEILFENRWADTNFACVSCAFHGSLISQLKCSLQEELRRPPAACFVCRSSGHLLELRQVEGGNEALSHDVLDTSSAIKKLATPTRKICTSCAYALQWLYKQSLKIFVRGSKPKAGNTSKTANARAKAVADEEEDEEEEEEEEEEPPSNMRSKRVAATKSKVEPSRSAKGKAGTTKITNGKVLPSRTSKKRYRDDSESEEEDSEDERPPVKSSRVAAKKVEVKTKASDVVLAQTRYSRKVVAPNRFGNQESEAAPKKAAGKMDRQRRAMKRAAPASVKNKLSKQQIKKEVAELIEYECEICSQMFYSGASAELHKLEHEGRYFILQLERCAVPISDNSSSEQEDDASSSSENKRKPRKPQKPVKNAARDRLNSEPDCDGSFVFAAPKRLPCPKSVKERLEGVIEYGFDKPTSVSPEEKDKENEFSDDEEENVTNNVDSCISSLESSETKAKEEEKEESDETTQEEDSAEKPNEETTSIEPVSEEQNKETTSPKPVSINQALSFDFESPASVSVPTTHSSANKSNCLKFDFEEPLSTKPKTQSNNTFNISTALSFDYNPPVEKTSNENISAFDMMVRNTNEKPSGYESGITDADTPDLATSTDNFLANAEDASMLAGSIDTSNALRDDSSNPTLPQPQSQPRETGSSFPFSAPEQTGSDLASIVSDV